MTESTRRPPGFAVFNSSRGARARICADNAAALVGDAKIIAADERTYVVLWGQLRHRDLDAPIVLCRAGRRSGADATDADTTRVLDRGGADLVNQILPPFAAIAWDSASSRFIIRVDWLGLRHVYVSELVDLAGASSSASVLAGASLARLDEEALGVQSLLGWQLGARTPFANVAKIPPGSRIVLSRGRLIRDDHSHAPMTPTCDPNHAAVEAAGLVSTFVSGYLDDHPDTVLQLTGGHDSRILLGAIPRARRSSIEAMTLAVPGSPDVDIAARLAADQGMKHRVIQLRGLDVLSDEDAYELCLGAARDLDCAADPVGFAALRWADSAGDQQPRLSGLGGEVARGFYYFGPTGPVGVSRERTSSLAEWRMFPNERVDADALEPAFAAMARETAIDGIHRALASGAHDWWPATDEFYLWQRMQRWAGTLATATCFDRVVINPMLDHAFLDIARGLPPKAKKNMRFLSRILLELDPALADIPLDNRPSPRVYSRPTPANRLRLGATQSRKLVGKAHQRWSRRTHPPAGGDVLTAKVLAHWRANPWLLGPVRELEIFRPQWVDQLLAGQRSADASTVALLVNLVVASEYTAAISAESASLRT